MDDCVQYTVGPLKKATLNLRDKPSGLCRKVGPCWEVCVKHLRFVLYIPIINPLSAIFY